MSEDLEIDDIGLPLIYKHIPVERLDPFMDRDYNLCVHCERCVRVCKKIHGEPAIDLIGRGKDARVGTAFHRSHAESGCVFCGACIDICPNGTLTDRFAKWYGQPDRTEDTTCTLCPLGCSLRLKIKQDTVIGSGMTAFTTEARICAIGRFVVPHILDAPARLLGHRIRVGSGQRGASYEEAVAAAAEQLAQFAGPQFTLIANPSATLEELHVQRKFAKQVMNGGEVRLATYESQEVESPPDTRAVFTTGDYVDADKDLDLVIVADVLPSRVSDAADVLFGAAVLAETEGSFLAASGEIRQVSRAVPPTTGLQPDWRIICDIARKMGASGFGFDSTADIKREMESSGIPNEPPALPSALPLDDVSALPRMYRGHLLAGISHALESLWPAETAAGDAAQEQPIEPEGRQFEIVAKTEIVPNTHMITVHAPAIAAACRPGQFVIAMLHEKSERAPYTVADWDRDAGTVTMVVLEAGRSSREMAMLQPGDHLAHFAGPLGTAAEIKKYGTVVCGGGCYGVGSILPIARALKEAGNRVICIEEASSQYLLYWQDRLAGVCDELLIATKDGTEGIKGGVQEAISMLVERGEKVDQAFIVGCTFMMMLVSETTKEHGIPTLTALNPIMLDGTGMCGACRVTVGDATMFACVDGPFLDGHQVDWLELMQRRSAYAREAIRSLPQDHRKHPCREA